LEFLPDVANLLKIKGSQNTQLRLAKRVISNLRTIHLYSKIWLEKLINNRVSGLWDKCFLPKRNYKALYLIIDSLNINKTFKPHPRLLSNLIHSNYPERADEKIYESVRKVFEDNFSSSIFETLSDAKLLGYVAPSLKKVIDLPQFDGYHIYSVDRHSIETLRALENIMMSFYRNFLTLYLKMRE